MGAIVVTNLGKTYRSYRSHWGRLAFWFGAKGGVASERWVLRNVSFALQPGEAVGIIGQNGAGKSTLLKLITGITLPAEGSINMSGRVSALLELGIGFHPYLTGRQNAFMAGSLIGLTRDDVARLMPEIEAFAEIGEYIDQPVRVYSSGMQARLAFSVATAVRPDVLIVDEVLSVGDAYFQHKSFERIRQFRKQGTTLLIVSHDRWAIQSICDRAILLAGGSLAKEGTPEEVMDYYNALIAERENPTVTQIKIENGRTQTISGTGEAQVEQIGLYNSQGEQVELVDVGEFVELRIQVRIHTSIPQLVLGYMIKDRLGQPMFGTNTWHTDQIVEGCKKNDLVKYSIRFHMNLGSGSYSISTALTETLSHVTRNFEWRDLAIVFNVFNAEKIEFAGCSWLEPKIKIEHTCSE